MEAVEVSLRGSYLWISYALRHDLQHFRIICFFYLALFLILFSFEIKLNLVTSPLPFLPSVPPRYPPLTLSVSTFKFLGCYCYTHSMCACIHAFMYVYVQIYINTTY